MMPAQALVAKLRDAGHPEPFFQHCDLRDIPALQAAIAAVRHRLGPITVLVNNAANDQRHSWEEVTPEYWDERQATNLRHQFFAIQAVAPMMREAGGGSIVNFGSISWHTAQGGMPAYTTAKAAVEGLTRGMARDLGPFGIRVNTVIPGWIMTERQITMWLTPEAEAAADPQPVPEAEAGAGGRRAAGAVAGRRRQPDVHGATLGRRRRPDVTAAACPPSGAEWAGAGGGDPTPLRVTVGLDPDLCP